MGDDPDDEIEVVEIEASFAGHAGFLTCEVWVKTADRRSISLRFSSEKARQFLDVLSRAADKLDGRSSN
jgi:hypothetical protein